MTTGIAGNGWQLECRQWMATRMWVMDGNRNVSNGWQLELQAMDGHQNCRQWMATGIAGNGWQPECGQWMATRMWVMDGNRNASNGWQPECE